MDDDFNTPEALAALQGLTREINSARDAGELGRAAALGAELTSLGNVLGILAVPAEEWARLPRPAPPGGQEPGGPAAPGRPAGGIDDAEVERRIAARAAARARRDFRESDRIRDELAACGVILEDKPGGETSWRRA
jgi:cysteinyl-tRNA synthetase